MKRFNDEEVYDIIQCALSTNYESDEDVSVIERYRERLLNKEYYLTDIKELDMFLNADLYFKTTEEPKGMVLSLTVYKEDYINFKKLKDRKRKINKINEHLVN